ncbi:MAG: nucleotide exchange factor GrpE [Phycisphaerae bacterium]|nr:nucleotide exchange factor GrpE [Phycisphaerae bacterium]
MSRKHDRKKDQPPGASPPAEGAAPPQAPEAAESLRAERDDLLARLQRVSADYLNYQKRVQRDIADAREFANADLIKSLLAVLDDMERALEAAKANHGADDPLLVGMQLVYDKAVATLGQYGLLVIKAAGEPFDPYKHRALHHEPSDAQPPGVVLAELQKGYELKGRVIRPTSVVVSGRAEEPAAEPAAEEAPSEPPEDQ